MPAVARALLGREDARDRHLEAVALPVGEAAGEVDDVQVAELLRAPSRRRPSASRRSSRRRAGGSCRARAPRCAARGDRGPCRSRRGCVPRPTRPARGRRRRATRPTTRGARAPRWCEISSISPLTCASSSRYVAITFGTIALGAWLSSCGVAHGVASCCSSPPSQRLPSRSSPVSCSPRTATRPERRRPRPQAPVRAVLRSRSLSDFVPIPRRVISTKAQALYATR